MSMPMSSLKCAFIPGHGKDIATHQVNLWFPLQIVFWGGVGSSHHAAVLTFLIF